VILGFVSLEAYPKPKPNIHSDITDFFSSLQHGADEGKLIGNKTERWLENKGSSRRRLNRPGHD
jgi:hypothetical protein